MRKICRERVAGGGGIKNRMVVAKGPMCRVRTTNQLIMAQPRYTVQYRMLRWFTSSECQAYLFSNCCTSTVHPHPSEKDVHKLKVPFRMHWNGFVRHSGRIGTPFCIRMQEDILIWMHLNAMDECWPCWCLLWKALESYSVSCIGSDWDVLECIWMHRFLLLHVFHHQGAVPACSKLPQVRFLIFSEGQLWICCNLNF